MTRWVFRCNGGKSTAGPRVKLLAHTPDGVFLWDTLDMTLYIVGHPQVTRFGKVRES